MSKPADSRRFRLIVRGEPGWDGPLIVRLRRAFKALLRQHGVRICEAVELPAEPAKAAADGSGGVPDK